MENHHGLTVWCNKTRVDWMNEYLFEMNEYLIFGIVQSKQYV